MNKKRKTYILIFVSIIIFISIGMKSLFKTNNIQEEIIRKTVLVKKNNLDRIKAGNEGIKQVEIAEISNVNFNKVIQENKVLVQKTLFSLSWELNEKDCIKKKNTKWRNNYDYTCDISLKENPQKLKKTTNQSYINDKLVMYRQYFNGVNEPLNFNNEQEDLKMFQFLLGDYAFMAIMLDENLLGKSFEFDLEAFKTSLKYKDIHQEKFFKKRFQNLLNSIEQIMRMLLKQCKSQSWQKSCDIVTEYNTYDLRSIANHHLIRNDL